MSSANGASNGAAAAAATAPAKCLIVNADDFGLSDGVNDGIIEAHERGIVTSTSLMVHQGAAEAAAAYGRRRPALSVGLHVDLGEWSADEHGKWEPVYQPVDTNDPRAVREEIVSQVTRFRKLMGSNPTHLDSHQHAHKHGPANPVLLAAGRKLGVPVRHFSRSVRYCGDFYGQGIGGKPLHERITPDALIGLLAGLPAGITEMCCHPGADDRLSSRYLTERRQELAALTDDRVRRAVREHGITLCSFANAPLNGRRRPVRPRWPAALRTLLFAGG